MVLYTGYVMELGDAHRLWVDSPFLLHLCNTVLYSPCVSFVLLLQNEVARSVWLSETLGQPYLVIHLEIFHYLCC